MIKSRWIRNAGVAVLVLGCVGLASGIKTWLEVRHLRAVAGDTFINPASPSAAVQSAITYAKSMQVKPYDPVMGKYGDLFGKVGFVVCIDVPVRSYEAAGISMPALLRESAHAHPEWFNIGPNNPPSSSFFYRRVRNYHPLFRNHPQLVADSKPRVGDWAFYGMSHIALVIDVKPDGKFEVVEASPVKMRVAISDSDYMSRTWGMPAFFGRLKGVQ